MKISHSTRKILAIIDGVLLSIVLIIGIFWVPFNKVILQPDAYKQAFVDQGLYNVFPGLVSEYLSGNSSNELLGGSLSQITSTLDPETVNQFMLGLIPPEWFQNQVDTNLTSLFAFINGKTENAQFFLDLVPIKDKLGTNESIKKLILLLPSCTFSDLSKLLSMVGGEGSLPLCRFPDDVMNIVYPLVQPYLIEMISTLPNQIPLTSISVNQSNSSGWIFGLIMILRKASNYSLILGILVIALLGIMILISYPGMKRALRYIGIPLIIAGSVGLALNLLIWIGINTSGITFIQTGIGGASAIISDVIGRIFQQLMNNYVMVAALMGFLNLVCGVILYVISRLKIRD
jgi:hypothetical protein